MSILSQAGQLVGEKIKEEKDARSKATAAYGDDWSAARSSFISDLDSYVGDEENAIDSMAKDMTATTDKFVATQTDAIDYVKSNVDGAALDSLVEINDALIAQDAAKDLGIITYFNDAAAAIDAHEAAYGTYAEFLVGFGEGAA